MTEKDRIVMATFEEKLHRLVYEHKQLEEANRELSRILEEKENTLKSITQETLPKQTANTYTGPANGFPDAKNLVLSIN